MNLKWTALTVVLGFAALSSNQVRGADIKDYHASGGCKVYGSTAWTSIGFGWQGLFNTLSTPVQVICPIIKDSGTAWDGTATTPTNPAFVHVHARSGNVAATVTCTVYTNYADGLTSTVTISIPMAANNGNSYSTSGALTSSGGSGSYDQGSMMLCNLGPKTALVHYYLYEYGTSE